MKRRIGITGGIASGKTTICEYLQSLGYPVIDSDAISRRLSQKDQPIYAAIVEHFGKEYLLPNLELDRKKLGQYIFQNSEARGELNAISHPLIVEEMEKIIKKTKENLIFLDIPLLFEAKLSYLCDTIVCVYVDYETQMRRLMYRDKISREYAEMKIASQMSLEEKRNQSDYVIESKDSFEETKKNVRTILEKIKGE